MKIAFLTHLFPPSIGGMQKWNQHMAEAYSRAGHGVTVYHLRMGEVPFKPTGYAYHPFTIRRRIDPAACPPQNNSLESICLTVMYLLRLLPRLRRYDIWQLTFGEPLPLKLLAVILIRLTKARLIIASGCVMYNHPYRPGLDRAIKHFLISRILAPAVTILVDGKDLRDELLEHGVPGSRINVCYAGVDTTLFRPVADRADFNAFIRERGITLLAGRPLVLYCSRFATENAPEVFLETIAAFSDIQALMVGDGPLRPGLEAQAVSLACPVFFSGSAPYDALPHLFSRADVCIYTYSNHIGGISQIIPLSMACGACVITTRIGDNAALIDHGVNGLLAQAGDIPALRQNLADVLRGVHDIASIKRNARDTILREWSLAARELQYQRIIAGICHSQSNQNGTQV
jgi:glycosyltransferase involved in cell wall biosynthesis